MWNKDTALKISQFNMNQNRLSGLASVLSGRAGRYARAGGRNDAKIWSDEWYAAGDDARVKARADFQNKGDYGTLNTEDFQVGNQTNQNGSLRQGLVNLAPPGLGGFIDKNTGGQPTPINDFSGGSEAISDYDSSYGKTVAPAASLAPSFQEKQAALAADTYDAGTVNTSQIVSDNLGTSYTDAILKDAVNTNAVSTTALPGLGAPGPVDAKSPSLGLGGSLGDLSGNNTTRSSAQVTKQKQRQKQLARKKQAAVQAPNADDKGL